MLFTFNMIVLILSILACIGIIMVCSHSQLSYELEEKEYLNPIE
jgi:hypothetical protein